jgi:phosphopantetheinyl transferase
MSAEEYTLYIKADDPQMYFFELWTLKEAAAKAVGLGLGADFSQITFTPSGSGRLAVRQSYDAYNYEACVLNLPYPAFFSVCGQL